MSRPPDRLARLARAHGLSGLLISFFTALHLVNQAAALGGPLAWSSFRALLRYLYQTPVYETLLLGVPILFNVATGIWMAARRDAARTVERQPAGMRSRLHRWAGLTLVALLLLHVVTTRGLTLAWRVDPDFNFLAALLSGARGAIWWLLYGLLVVAASFHLANGLFTLLDGMGAFPGRRARAAAAGALILVGVAMMVCGFIGLLSFGGVLYQRPRVETLPLD